MSTAAAPVQAATTLKTEVFAKVPAPGFPEGVVVSDENTIYVGTHQSGTNPANAPSHVFAYDKNGNLKKDYVIQGQASSAQGILGMALDKQGNLYILDRHPSRIIRLNPKTGEQSTYATFHEVKPCVDGQPAGDCSAESEDRASYADDLVFAPDGTLYVTDIQQALIWKVPNGGGEAKVWYTDPDLDSVFGANGIRFADNGKTLVLAVSLYHVTDPNQIFSGRGRIYKLPVNNDGSPGTKKLIWEAQQDGEGPDGFAIGQSGNLYVSLALPGALLVLSPDGQEITRTPATPEENQQQAVPYSLPANVAFTGTNVLITNQDFFADGPNDKQVLFKVNVGECGKALFRPYVK
nr:SMP-30/gluconolactonase/LRE family protein [Shimazuella soli]